MDAPQISQGGGEGMNETKPRPVTSTIIEDARVLHRKGYTAAEIADKLNVAKGSIIKHLRKRKVIHRA